MSTNIPTEREILRCIYDMYEKSFPVHEEESGKVFIQIDLIAIAKKLKCDKDILFGYIYYHLNHKYNYSTGINSSVALFAKKTGQLQNAINFPYLSAILASQDQEHSKFIWSLGVSLVALALSVGSIIAQLITAD